MKSKNNSFEQGDDRISSNREFPSRPKGIRFSYSTTAANQLFYLLLPSFSEYFMHSAAVGDPFCDTNQAYRSLVCYVLFGHDPSLQGLFAKESPAHCWLQISWGWVTTLPASNTSARPTSYTACAIKRSSLPSLHQI